MDCYVCRDKGVVTWIEQRGGYPYEFMGRCDCRAGRSVEGLQAAAEHLSPFEISEISEKNKQIETETKKRREQNTEGE